MLIIAHNAVVCAVFAHFTSEAQDECPSIDFPLHTVLKPRAYGAEEQVFSFKVEHMYENKTPDSGNRDGQ